MRRLSNTPAASSLIRRVVGSGSANRVAGSSPTLVSTPLDLVSYCMNERRSSRSTSSRNSNGYQVKSYHTSVPRESGLIFLGVTMTGAALAVKYGMNIYNDYQAKKASEPPKEQKKEEVLENEDVEEAKVTSKASDNTTSNSNKEDSTSSSKGDSAKTGEASGGFNFDFLNMFGKNFYDGGFEDKMTKREAALILGIRESATVERIKEAHRRILLNNHPDRGGSPYMASKINEAKDLLMKTKGSS